VALEIFDYQKVGAELLASRPRYGLFDEMRVGKSAQAIRAADLLGLKRGIVICPGTAREVWRGEFNKFGIIPRNLIKGVDIHDYVAWMRGRFDVLITSYEQATRWAPRIHEQGEVLGFAIVDEMHYCKNSEAARTKAILGDFTIPPGKAGKPGIVDWALHVWGLTGTPMANDPMDIYTFLRFVGCMPLAQGVFQKRYFHEFKKTYGSRNTPRPDKVEELKRLIQNNSLRRTQKEAGLQLPPIFLTGITLDGDTTQIRELLGQFPGLDIAILDALKVGGLSFLDSQHIATLRRLVAEAKAVPYAELLFDELQNTDEKFVVMGISKQALRHVQTYLLARGVNAVLVNGDVPEKHRGPLIEEFQTNPQCRVFCGNLRSAGTAISLTAARMIDILESSWDPGTIAQGVMRVQGVSQKRQITARFITLAGSIDEAVNEIVAGKTASIVAAQGSQVYSHEPSVDGVTLAA
jgi:SWI/SNF-related matrix-associated actin-dependent regulator of chromatin subfamily A-like protein 1